MDKVAFNNVICSKHILKNICVVSRYYPLPNYRVCNNLVGEGVDFFKFYEWGHMWFKMLLLVRQGRKTPLQHLKVYIFGHI